MIYEILIVTTVVAAKPELPPVQQCVRWSWTNDIYDRKVICIEYRIKDCNNRMYESICRTGV
jgi:hypothetical protein